MTTNKIKVKETTSIDSYSFEGKLEEIIEMLQDWKNEGKWEGIEIDYYEEGTNYQLYKHREETDKEYEKRMKQLEKKKWIELGRNVIYIRDDFEELISK